MMVKEGGWGAMLALLVGSLGVILGIVSLALLPISRKVAHAMGVVTLLVAFLAPAIGLLGMASGRRMTDGAISGETVGRGMKSRIRYEGYRESQSAARIGFYAAVLPLLLGATAALLGARKKPEDQPGSLRWALAGVGSGIAFLTAGGAFAASVGPLPPQMPMEDARLVDARDEIDWAIGSGCDHLEEVLNESYWRPADKQQWPRQFSPDPRTAVPDFDAVATKCARNRSSISPARGTREDLLRSPLLVDAALRKELQDDIAKSAEWGPGGHDIGDSFSTPPYVVPDGGRGEGIGLGNIGTFGGGGPHPTSTSTVKTPSLRQGATTVNGRLPPEVIQRIVRQNYGRFRLCYETGLLKNPALEGTVKVKFVIDTAGSVSSTSDGGSDLPDTAVVQCVVRSFSSLSFPQPEGGIVVVNYPIIFKAGT